jgi:hypothetical protein
MRGAGCHGVVERIAQILLVCVLREHLDLSPETVGALGALADGQLGRAVQAIHERPGFGWTVEALAT